MPLFKLTPMDVIVFLFAFLAPLQATMLAVGFLLVVDFITGVWASIKVHGWRSINSARMSDSVTKIIIYNLAILVSYTTEKYLVTAIPLTQIAVGFIAVVEIMSVYENVRKVTGLDLRLALKSWMNKNRDSVTDIFRGTDQEKKD